MNEMMTMGEYLTDHCSVSFEKALAAENPIDFCVQYGAAVAAQSSG